jgi:hypothetical protein
MEGLPAPAAGTVHDPLKRARVDASQEDIAAVDVTATGTL